MSSFVEIAVKAPLHDLLTYDTANLNLHRGESVLVPLGKRTGTGIVVRSVKAAPAGIEMKSVLGKDEERPQIPEAYMSWAEWLARYYVYPLGLILDLFFPPLEKKGRASQKKPVVPIGIERAVHALTPEQSLAVQNIESQKGFSTHLLFGITGSGKTEVYLQLLDKILKRGERGLVLVPEISLTPQLVDRFSARFGEDVAVLHSQLTGRERTEQWWKMVSGEKRILIGARSALFCPIPNLGLIVIDEEHEPSFKQDEKFRYHARDAAVVLARGLNIPIVLGSATPSLESWHNVVSNKYLLHELPSRVGAGQLPSIEVVDLKTGPKKEALPDGHPEWLSFSLKESMVERFENKEQTALFLNRRGLAQVVLCPACGAKKSCPNCEISLSLHANIHLVCHYCDHHEDLHSQCEECKESEMRAVGIGTERVEKDIQKMFPDKKILRADRDEIHSREALEEFIQAVENREVDIIVGTQMIAKGLDFPGLTLVGILLADIAFNLPDFRASERSFQLLAQMSGRAGRHVSHGTVVLQTYNPEHPSIEFAKQHNYRGFAEAELLFRKELNYPPFGRLALLRFLGNDLKKTRDAAHTITQFLEPHAAKHSFEILGPAPCPLSKIRGKHRYQILLKSSKNVSLSDVCKSASQKKFAGVQIQVDIDPVQML